MHVTQGNADDAGWDASLSELYDIAVSLRRARVDLGRRFDPRGLRLSQKKLDHPPVDCGSADNRRTSSQATFAAQAGVCTRHIGSESDIDDKRDIRIEGQGSNACTGTICFLSNRNHSRYSARRAFSCDSTKRLENNV
jgi:hypothetical protein